jgi:hypothetical protein
MLGLTSSGATGRPADWLRKQAEFDPARFQELFR